MTEGLEQVQCLGVVWDQNHFVTGLSLYQGKQSIQNQNFAWKSQLI